MGSIPPEVSLDVRPPLFFPKTITDFLMEISKIGSVSEKLSKLDDFVKGLEEEMRKIDAFKRELPLCMLLLKDAIIALKEESMYYTAKSAQPILEEFIPLKKRDCHEEDEEQDSAAARKKEKDCRDKKNWMSSFQLWNSEDLPSSTANHRSFDPNQTNKLETKRKEEESQCTNGDLLFQTAKNRANARTIMPFKGFSGFRGRKEDKEEIPAQGLSLSTTGIKSLRDESNSGSRTSCSRAVSSSAATISQSNFRSGPQPPHQQTCRKQRRCWSPDLHRRFINALQQLGGSQVATPKQIRELMQVDGLTNDEVKSHLQKYRLHTRRLPSTNSSAVVLGGLWMSQDQYGESSKPSNCQSGSPQGPLQLTSTTGGDSMEDEGDAKSESYSWKGHINNHKLGKDDV